MVRCVETAQHHCVTVPLLVKWVGHELRDGLVNRNFSCSHAAGMNMCDEKRFKSVREKKNDFKN